MEAPKVTLVLDPKDAEIAVAAITGYHQGIANDVVKQANDSYVASVAKIQQIAGTTDSVAPATLAEAAGDAETAGAGGAPVDLNVGGVPVATPAPTQAPSAPVATPAPSLNALTREAERIEHAIESVPSRVVDEIHRVEEKIFPASTPAPAGAPVSFGGRLEAALERLVGKTKSP